jgi:hypothetical protein
MRILLVISVIAFVTLSWTCIAIARHVARARKRRIHTIPAEPPRNLANPL